MAVSGDGTYGSPPKLTLLPKEVQVVIVLSHPGNASKVSPVAMANGNGTMRSKVPEVQSLTRRENPTVRAAGHSHAAELKGARARRCGCREQHVLGAARQTSCVRDEGGRGQTASGIEQSVVTPRLIHSVWNLLRQHLEQTLDRDDDGCPIKVDRRGLAVEDGHYADR
jgi:hypothetical protein